MATPRCFVPLTVEGRVYWEQASGHECSSPFAVQSEPPAETPSNGGDTPDTIGAPTPPAPSAAPPTADPSLTDQYYRPNDPQPDYGIAGERRDEASAAGTAPSDLDAAVEETLDEVLKNAAPKGARHPVFSASRKDVLDTAADPILLFSGQYALDVTDVEIASVGFPLRLTRVYRSGATYYGPWGYNWDHNYNVSLRELTDGTVAIWTGRIREEVYTPNGATFEPPVGVFRLLERVAPTAGLGPGYALTEPGGTRLAFHRPAAGWPEPLTIPLVYIEDRHGNRQTLSYDAEGRLDRVTDDAGRFLEFTYGGCGLLEQVRDHTLRTWRYIHDADIEHLVAVVGPATADVPDGPMVRYEYDRWRPHPALRHNLTRVIDAEQQVVVENRYEDDPGSDDFGRVVSQLFAGFEATFHATVLQSPPPVPEALHVSAVRVEMMDPLGRHVYTFNYRGDLLDARYRMIRDGSYRVAIQTFRYDLQANVVEWHLPDEQRFLYEYDHLALDPRARGNLTKMTEAASPLVPAPARIVVQLAYEPRFQLVRNSQDVEGAVTAFSYDHDLSPAGTGRLVGIRHPVATLPDGTVQSSTESFTHNAAGQVLTHTEAGAVHVFTYDTVGWRRGYLLSRHHTAGGAAVGETFEYDDVGNVVAKIDGEGNRTEHAINALGLVSAITLPDGAVYKLAYSATGRLAAIEEPRGDYDDPVLAGTAIRHIYSYDALGAVVDQTLAANTVSPARTSYKRGPGGFPEITVEPSGRVIKQTADELGRLLTLEVIDATGNRVHREDRRYSVTGHLVSSQVQGLPPSLFAYDGFGRRLRTETPRGAIARYVHDDRGLLAEVSLYAPPGNAADLLGRQRWERDERGRVRRQIEALFDSPVGPVQDVVTTFWLDEAGRPSRIDDAGGLTRSRTYNANGVLVEERDSLGNSVRLNLDLAGRVASIDTVERADSGAVSTGTLSWTYNQRGQIRTETDQLNNTTTYDYDSRGTLRLATNPLGQTMATSFDALGRLSTNASRGVTMNYQYGQDALGRRLSVIDPGLSVTTFSYDALERPREERRPDGKTRTWEYGSNGRMRRLVDFDGSVITVGHTADGLPDTLNVAPAPGVAVTPPLSWDYDAIGRLTTARSGSIAHTLRYDSLSRLIGETGPDNVAVHYDAPGRTQHLTYPDGRRDRIDRDPAGRVASITLEVDGALGLTAQGIPPGSSLARIGWAGIDRPERVQLAGGLTSTQFYDAGSRLSGLEWTTPSGSVFEETLARDAIGLKRVDRRQSTSSETRSIEYDGLARIERVLSNIPASSLPASTDGMPQAALDALIGAASAAPRTGETAMAYTSRDTPGARTEMDGAGTVLAVRTFASNNLGQVISADGVPIAHDNAGCHKTFGTRELQYDGLRRLVQVRQGGTAVLNLAYDGLGRVHTRDEAGHPTERLAYIGDEPVQITTAGGVVRQFTLGPGLDQPLLLSDTSESYAPVYDSTGSLVAACGVDGTVRERYHYDLFGAPRITSPDGLTTRLASAIGQRPLFHGRPYLDRAGLYDFRARFYDPSLFIFVQPDDELFLDSWSPYAFSRYNPLNFGDPYGRWAALVGALVGAGVGAIGTALSGGDGWDIAVAAVAGAVGGALASSGNVVLGGAAAGAIMGGWAGGRIGYDKAGAEGAALGGLGGALLGAGLGALTAGIGARIGGAVSQRVSGGLNRYLTNRAVSNRTAGIIRSAGGTISKGRISGATAWSIAEPAGQGAGGVAGNVSAGVVGNLSATAITDVATGRPITAGQMWDATWHGIVIDGSLGAVGAPVERLLWVRGFPGRVGNRRGSAGENLVGREFSFEPARGRENLTINGRGREPDFFTTQTMARHNAVFEVKNKAVLERGDVAQIRDFADYATGQGGEVWVFGRPGLDLSSVAGIPGVRTMVIPQRPLVVSVPTPFADSGKNSK